MSSEVRPRRLSFLLRLWRAGNGDAPQWRVSLEDTQTHALHGFEDLAGLVAFLEAQLEYRPAPRDELKQDGGVLE